MSRQWSAILIIVAVVIVLVVITALLYFLPSDDGLQPVNQARQENSMDTLQLTSPAFAHNSMIPDEYTCTGSDINPPLVIARVPAGTKSLALIMDDPDAPVGTWDHWIMWNIAPDAGTIGAHSVPAGAVQGRNSWGRSDYGGPCPPSGIHRYHFKLFALSDVLSLAPGSDKNALMKAIEATVLAETTLVGLYSK